MKIAKAAYTGLVQKSASTAILPLIDEDLSIDDSTKCSTFKLRSQPTDADSPKYSLTVPILDDTASVRQALKWTLAVAKVMTGLNITDGTNKHPLVQELCTGSHLVAYNSGVNTSRGKRWAQLKEAALNAEPARDEAGGEDEAAYWARLATARDNVAQPGINNADITAGLNHILTELCPYKALEKQKRFMRRHMRKPADMTTRTYAANLIRINSNELTMLPPFQTGQSLTNDELIDIITYGIPKSWTRKMDEHDFDPFTKGIHELINFCERMEASENFERAELKIKTPPSSSKKHKSHRNNPNKGKWCHYHEVDTHDTKDCETLKKLKNSKSDSKPSFKNKTWKRKSDDAKSHTKKELAAIGRKASAKAIKKAKGELNAMAKRKNESSDSESSSGSEDENSVHLMEKMDAVDKQLADFNFDGTKSDGEISC